MSYDLSIGGIEFNVTYNLSRMFYHFHEKGIRAAYGLSGRDALPIWRAMREHFEDNEQVLREMEPANGWGTYDVALDFISSAIMASIRRPDNIWEGD
jgi:hypothetical protein